MPPKKTSEAGSSSAAHDCTESEIKLMIALMELMPRPSIDYEALAAKLGSASTNAARMRVTTAVKQHPTWFAGPGAATAATSDDGTPIKKPRAKRAPKKKAPSDEDDENAEEQATPSKKRARTAKGKAAMKQEPEGGADDGAEKEDGDGMESQI
ncbi:hypothetical protein CTRI78_v003451 [Colletotrichum trifolii]|uniref:Uncharacterized protein n=1 Tax=Colletotrichum trifolii TaxID=5466 RepID=A0A4V3HWU9_COLTR|nr:hypothetical protein CTRI78_v003451 [Colletotrichum trifolii]